MELFIRLFRAIFLKQTVTFVVSTKKKENGQIFLIEGEIWNVFFRKKTGNAGLYDIVQEEVESIIEEAYVSSKIPREICELSEHLLLRLHPPTPLPLPFPPEMSPTPDFSMEPAPLVDPEALLESKETSGDLPILVDPSYFLSSLMHPSHVASIKDFLQEENLLSLAPLPDVSPSETPLSESVDFLFFRFLALLIEGDRIGAKATLSEIARLIPRDPRLQNRWIQQILFSAGPS